MKNKKTVLILTDSRGASGANAIKAMLSAGGETLAIIIDKSEFRGIAARYAKERLLSEDGVVRSNWERFKNKLYERRSEDVREWKLEFKSNNYAHQKMANAITRYNPEVIIVTAENMLELALIGRKKANPDAKVVVVPAEYSLNLQYICGEVDAYLIHNSATKDELISGGVDAEKVEVVGMPIAPSGMQEHKACVAELGEKLALDPNKKTVLFLGATNDTGGIAYALEEAMPAKDDYNYIVYCGQDRSLLDFCKKEKIVALNEGMDFYNLVNIADFVVTRPISTNLTASFAQKVVVYLLKAEGKVEERYAQNVADAVIDCSVSTTLIAKLTTEPTRDEREDLAEGRDKLLEGVPSELFTHAIQKML
ncbi:MAG: hypothetical protein R3Y23_06380 [Bacillota bacterium]